MSNRTFHPQILVLFLSNFTIYTVGMGLLPLLPLYAARFGASQAFVGIYLTITYLSNALGHLLTGWIAGRFPPRVVFVTASLLGVPALLLLGRVTSLWQLVALTAMLWLFGGMDASTIGAFTGLHAGEKSRGKSFSLMSVAMPLGALAGGALTGYLVARHGYALMFAGLASLWAMLPLLGVVGLKDKTGSRPGKTAPPGYGDGRSLGNLFYLVLAFSFFSATAINVNQLGRSLSMQALDFSPQAVASTATASGLIAIPFVLLNGALSDRLARTRFLFLGYALTLSGSLALAGARHLWQFWFVSTVTLLASTTNGALTYALVTDRLSSEKLSRALAFLNATGAMAGILSFSTTGFAMQQLGPTRSLWIASLLPVLAGLLLLLFQSQSQAGPPAPLTRNMALLLGQKRQTNSSPVSARAGVEGC